MGAWRLRLRLVARRWRYFYSSIWFFPVVMAIGALLLFAGTTMLDRSAWLTFKLTQLPGWAVLFLFAGDASSAQSLLSTVAGMWATIIGISFSVTLVTTQLTATKYIAQVLPLFERDKINQVVLGQFLATVIYALLVLRTVRVGAKEGDADFVPLIGVNIAMLFAVIALFLLIMFISNTINLVRPQYFMARTARDTDFSLREAYRPEALPYLEPAAPEALTAHPPEHAQPIMSPRSGMLTSIGWEALYLSALDEFRRERGRGGRWELYLHKQVGELVERGEVLGHLVAPDGASRRGRLARWVQLAHEVHPRRRHVSDPDYGIESLAGLTIKGATQGDLDVAFVGIDYMFTLLPALAACPTPAASVRLRAGADELVIHRPVTDLLGKYMRELTLISEVALAPSLPFRQLTEGISTRFRTALEGFATAGQWDRFDRVLPHLYGWYESAFFHLGWINGMRHLAMDLAHLALHVRATGHPGAFEAVLNLMFDVRDRLAADSQAREALADAFAYLAREADLPWQPLMRMPEIGQAAPDDGRGG